MEGKLGEIIRIPKRTFESLSLETRTLVRLAEPLLGGTPMNLAIWVFTLMQLVETDLDHGTALTKQLYPELQELDFSKLLSKTEEFSHMLIKVRGRDFFQAYQNHYQTITESNKIRKEKVKQTYPQYVEIAAKWWKERNLETFTKMEEEQFMNRLRRKIDEQIREETISLICVKDYQNGLGKRITLNLGGYEQRVIYQNYMAMIASSKEISVQIGRASAWKTIWKEEES